MKMRLKEGRDHHVYEVEDMHLEPGLERRMGALGDRQIPGNPVCTWQEDRRPDSDQGGGAIA